MTAALTDVDGHHHVAWVAALGGRPVGIARYLLDDAGVAEVAFEVVDAYHGAGIGTALVDAVTTVAAARGVRRVRASVLPSNRPSRTLVARLGVRLVPADGLLEGEGPLRLLDPPRVDRRAVVALACQVAAAEAWRCSVRCGGGLGRMSLADQHLHGPIGAAGAPPGSWSGEGDAGPGSAARSVRGRRRRPARACPGVAAAVGGRLVKLLALQPSHRLHREQVIDALWPEVPLETGAARLHTAAHYARVALGEPDSVVVAQGAVALYPDADVEVDVTAFERAVEAARDG